MTFPERISACRVAVVGLGLMGGSLAQALRGHCAALFGVDPDPKTLELASRLKLADRLSGNPAGIIPVADLIVLAAPVRAILSFLTELPALHPGRAIILDLGSTKVEICKTMEALPPRFEVIGGHPMCGKEHSSLAHADPEIFNGAAFAFTPLPRTTERARSFAAQIAAAVGAKPLWLDPETHDLWTASTSHLPYLVASALAGAAIEEASPLVGPGFLSTTRLAASSSSMMLDILLTNRQQVLEASRRFRKGLESLERLLADNDETGLSSALEHSSACREALTASKLKGYPQ
jgi:prephenate dehydrogenase